VRFEDVGKVRDLKHLADGGTRRGETQGATGALRAGVSPDESADASTIDRADAAEVYDQVFVTRAHECAQL
ncbi:MAG: hypothetical protein ABL961_00575, partial [Vicinamibacterales bacterium]